MTKDAVLQFFQTCSSRGLVATPDIPQKFFPKAGKIALEIINEKSEGWLFWNKDKELFTYVGDPEDRARMMIKFLLMYWKIVELF